MTESTPKTNSREISEVIYINGLYYEKEILKSDIVRPSLLTVDHNSNVLYFSLLNTEEEELPHKSVRLDLKTKEFNLIDVIGGYCQTVDQKTGDVYIGGDDGLYKYKINTCTVEFIGEKGSNILSIYYKDLLYFTTVESRYLHTFTNGVTTRFTVIPDLEVENFVIDCDDDMFFINDDGLYFQKKDTCNPILYTGLEDMVPISLTTDLNGAIYACYREGIFKVDKERSRLDKVVDLNGAFGAAFDSDNNIIYADFRTIVRLKPRIC